MEESKKVVVIFAVPKTANLNEGDIKEYLKNPDLSVELITSPKGFKVLLDASIANDLFEQGEDTLK